MISSFFLCQFLYAADPTQQRTPNNDTASRIRDFYNTDSPPKGFHYPCAKAKDAATATAYGILRKFKECVFGHKPEEKIDFKKMIDAALGQVAEDACGDNIPRNLEKFRDWFKTADLSTEGLPDIWLQWIEGLVPHNRKTQSMRAKITGVLPTQVLQSFAQNILEPDSKNVGLNAMINTQIEYDVQFLLLAIQLEHTYLQLSATQNWDDSYFESCSQYMSAMAWLLRYPVTATAPWLKDWLKHAERYDAVTKMRGWSEVRDRIRYPYLDDTRILGRFVYEAAFMGVLALSVCSLYLWIYNYPVFVDLFAGLGIINGTNSADQAPEISRSMVEEMVPSPSHGAPLRRGMQTTGIDDILSNVTKAVQNSSLALRSFAETSVSMPCEERTQWLINIFGRAAITEGNWVTCIIGLGASNAYSAICQMLSTGTDQYASAFGQCQPSLNGTIDTCKAQIVFGPKGGVVYHPGPCDFNAFTSKPETPAPPVITEKPATSEPATSRPLTPVPPVITDAPPAPTPNPLTQKPPTPDPATIVPPSPNPATPEPSTLVPTPAPTNASIPVGQGNCTVFDAYVAGNAIAQAAFAARSTICNSTDLRLNWAAIGPTEIDACIPAMIWMTNVTAAYFNNANIGNAEIQKLVPVLQRFPDLQDLQFTNTPMDNAGGMALIPLLTTATHLFRLTLQRTAVGDDVVIALIPYLKKLGNLIVLSVPSTLNTTTKATLVSSLPGVTIGY